MRHPLNLLAAASLVLWFLPGSGLSQEAPPTPASRVSAVAVPFFRDLSAVGSDGVYYRVRHKFGILSLPVSPAIVPQPPVSLLEAIDPSPNSVDPIDSMAFAGLASHLAIGNDNRLYLVVNVTPPVSITAGETTNLVPVPPPQSRLYVIPTPFPPRILRASLESIAAQVNLPTLQAAITEEPQRLDTIVQTDFEGHAQSLKVRAVGDVEHIYVSAVIPSYRFPTLTNTEDTVPFLGPIEPKVKLVIFDSNGRKIKEVNTE